jgi:hypothetical protein
MPPRYRDRRPHGAVPWSCVPIGEAVRGLAWSRPACSGCRLCVQFFAIGLTAALLFVCTLAT